MGEVVEPVFVTKLDLPAERILRKATENNLSEAIVIGLDQDGNLYFASSNADGADVLWLIELAKKRLLEIGDVG
jgi:tryptophanyl-tRNA synthetase